MIFGETAVRRKMRLKLIVHLVRKETMERDFERLPHETLMQFRDRILDSPLREELQSTADWYADYSAIRYHDEQQTEVRIAQLELSWKNLLPKTPGL